MPPGHPKEGGLVAVYPGRDAKLKAMLLLAHIDVVEAKREDWTRDPFSLLSEEDGKFYARGVVDDKAEATIFVDSLGKAARGAVQTAPHDQARADLRARKPTGALNGAQWLTEKPSLTHRRLPSP